MADEKIVTSIVANSDFSNLIADVQRVTTSLSKLQQEFAGSNRALAGQISAANAMFNQTMLKTGQFSSHFVSLTSDVEKFGRNLDSGRLKLRDYFRVYQDHVRTHGGLIRDLAKQQVQLQNAVLQPLGRNAQGLMQYNVHIPRGLDLTKNKTSLLKQELQIMNKVIQDGGVQLINWGKNTQWAGRQLTVGLTLPLAAFGKAAADAFKVADQELTRLTKVYGDVAGTSAQELSKIRDEVSATAKELSSAMGVNFAETIALAADIAATGKTGNELLASVSETTRLAVLGEVDRQEAMKATLAIQSAFKQNTDELADSINFLNAVENQTSTTLNDLVEAIPKAGPVIKGLGGDVQDLALYLTAMREGGINASEGANALKSALASLINPTDVAVDKFKGFGIDLLGIVKNNAGDVTATLFALQAALDRLDPLSKQQAIEQLFGKFQFSRLNALFENLGRQGSQTLQVLDLMSASAAELEAVASRELTAVTESAAGRFRRAVEGLKADLAGVGEDFLNIGTKLLNVLGGIIDFAQKLPDPIKKLLTFGGAFTAIIGPVIMLTGVLANFFGYIIKGLGHFRALFKGAEGFRLLTPEIMAARNASEMLGNEFYSDAKAADTLRLAIERLNEDLIGLQVNATNATKATSGLGQVLITSAGTPIMPMGGLGGTRQVIEGHPLLGGESRAAAHLNPRNPNDPSTIFGLTLQPIPLNRRIGRTPQILMSERLPDIEGLTSVGGASTGVVAGEHARYAALMATLGMQSRQEIEALKKTIGLGGQVSREFIDTFDDILPITQRLTANAAAQSTAIVADLRAGKITVEQAKAAIIAANAELERLMGVQVTQYATGRGRTIDLTKAPLIDQPVVDIAGKPNTRGMFRTGIFRDVMDALGRATRTRTLGGPYSIETTRRLNKGGGVFYNNGDQVPGPAINADIVPAMLTPGEFVIRRDVAQSDPDGMRALNEGRAMVVPFQANTGGQVPGYNRGALVRAIAGSRTRDIAVGGRFGSHSWQARNAATAAQIDDYLMSIPNPADRMRAAAIIESFAGTITTARGSALGRARYPGVIQPGHISREQIGLSAILQANGLPAMGTGARTHQTHLTRASVPVGGGQRYVSRYVADYDWLSNQQAKTGNLRVSDFIARNVGRSNKYNTLFKQVGIPQEKWQFVENEIDSAISAMLAGKQDKFIGDNFGDLIFERDFVPIIDQVMVNNGASPSQITAIKRNTVLRGKGRRSPFGEDFTRIFHLNRGGIVPGYQGGGGISRAGLLAKLGAKFKYEGKSYEGPQALKTYRISAMDIDGGKKYFGHIPGLSDKGKGALYNATLDFFNTSMIKGEKINGKRMFTPLSMLTAFPTISQFAITAGKDFLPASDIAILQSMAGKSGTLTGSIGSSRQGMAKVYGRLFTANRGGMVPGYRRGGGVVRRGRKYYGEFPGTPLRSSFEVAQERFANEPLQPQMTAGAMGSPVNPYGFRGMLMPSILSMAGYTGGSALGGRFGQTGSMIGGMLGGMLAPSLLTGWSRSAGEAAAKGNLLSRALGAIVGGFTKTNLVIGAATAAVFAATKIWSDFREGQRISAAEFGLTAESAEKAGLKYTDYTQKIKDAVAAQKLMIDQNKLTYDSMQSAGTPFKMTIQEYKNLRKELKDTMQEQIKVINSASNAKVNRVAVQLKEQLMAAGLSAEEAAKRIYTLFNLSNKAGMALSVLNTEDFKQITDAQTAAASAVETFNIASGQGNPLGAESTRDRVAALNTALTALNTGIDDLYTKSEKTARKNKETFNETNARYEAEKKQLDIINSKVENQVQIGSGVLNNLKKQNPEIAKFLRETDTVVSIFQKLRLVAMGFTGDLSKMNAQQVDLVYKLQIATAKAVESVNREGMLKDQYKAYDQLKKQRDALEKAAKGQSVREQIDTKERLKALDKEIKKINEKAEAKKKALREESQAEDMALRIQQQKLEYEKAVASGDFGGAATAQIEIRRLQNEQQTVLTEQQIEERRLKDLRPFERERERIQNAQEDMANKAALAAESLESMNKRLQAQKDKIDNVNTAMTNLKVALMTNKDNIEKFKTTDEFKGLAAKLVEATRAAGISTPSMGLPDVARGQLQPENIGAAAMAIMDQYGAGINAVLAQGDVTVTATGDIIVGGEKLGGGGGKNTPGSSANPFKPSVNPTEVSKNQRGFLDDSSKKKILLNLLNTEDVVKAGQFFEWDGVKYKIKGLGSTTEKGGVYTDIRGFDVAALPKKAGGGLLVGPGTGTSDSILGMYANGGMVRVSNGEYIVNADTVSRLGVPFFDRINGMKNGGLMLNYSIPKYEDGGPMISTTAYNPAMGGSVYNVGNVTMQFAQAPANGKQLFEEFKMAMALEERKSGTQINMSRRY